MSDCRFSTIGYLRLAILARDTEARSGHVSVCSGRRPSKLGRERQLRVARANRPRSRTTRSSPDAQGEFQIKKERYLTEVYQKTRYGTRKEIRDRQAAEHDTQRHQ